MGERRKGRVEIQQNLMQSRPRVSRRKVQGEKLLEHFPVLSGAALLFSSFLAFSFLLALEEVARSLSALPAKFI